MQCQTTELSAVTLVASAGFEITGHEFARASSSARVALYIGADVFGNGCPFSRRGIAEECAALRVGESVSFARVPFRGVDVSRPVTVRRVA